MHKQGRLGWGLKGVAGAAGLMLAGAARADMARWVAPGTEDPALALAGLVALGLMLRRRGAGRDNGPHA